MAKKNKMVESLVDGTEIYTTPKGWDKAKIVNQPVQAAGWAEGASPHFSFSKGLMVAMLDTPDKFPGVKLGDFDANGTMVPIVDPNQITDLVIEAFCEKYDIEAAKIKVATSRVSTRKAGQTEMLNSMKEMGLDEATLTLLKTKFSL